jgi:YVTN family beta-propeller protein
MSEPRLSLKRRTAARLYVVIFLAILCSSSCVTVFAVGLPAGPSLSNASIHSEKTLSRETANRTPLSQPPSANEWVPVADRVAGSAASTISGGFENPTAIAYDSSSGYLYVANEPSGGAANLTIINGATDTISGYISNASSRDLDTIVFDPANGYVYASNYGGGKVWVVNSTTNASAAFIPSASTGAIAFDSANRCLYVADESSSSVNIINGSTNGVVGTIPVGVEPYAIAFDSSNGFLYVANLGSKNVTVINGSTNEVVKSIPTPWAEPVGLTYDPADGDILVSTPYPSFNMTVINASENKVVGSLGIRGGFGLVYDDESEFVYIDTGNSVTVVNGTTLAIVGEVPVGQGPDGLSFDSKNGNVYSADTANNSISVIPASTPLSAAVNPSSASLQIGSNQTFQASISCIDGACNNGPSYRWQLSDSVGSLNATTGRSVNFTGLELGTSTLMLNATLNGYSVLAAVSITVTQLTVAISPTAGLLVVGGNQVFSVSTNCSGPLCNTSLGFDWSLSNGVGGLNSTTGASIRFTAGPSPGTTSLRVNSELAGNQSGSVAITISVVPRLSATLTTDKPGIDANSTILFNASLAGGTGGPYVYNYTESSPLGGCTFANAPVLSCTPRGVGSFYVEVNVTNAAGESAVATSPAVNISSPLRSSLTVSNSTPLLGQTVAFVANATGGVGPYSYNYAGFPPGCVSIDSPAVGCLPTQANFYNITLTVTDQNDVSVSSHVSIHVIFDFNVIVPSNTSAGSPFTISVNTNESFSGGTAMVPSAGFGAFTYNYTGLPPGCASKDAASITCTPTQVGTYQISVSVHDQVGDHNTHSVVVNVVPAKSGTASSGFLGLGNTGYLLVGGGVAVVAAGVLLAALRSRKSRREGEGVAPSSTNQPPSSSQ